MAHQVQLNINAVEIGKKDIEVIVGTDEGKLGTLLISKGNIEWRPKGNSVNKIRLTWSKFDALMKERGIPTKTKKPKG